MEVTGDLDKSREGKCLMKIGSRKDGRRKIETVSRDNSWRVQCRREQRSGVLAGEGSVFSRMRERMLRLYIDGNSPVESEKVVALKRKRITGALLLSSRERDKKNCQGGVDFRQRHAGLICIESGRQTAW